tara:strand:+ start:461 stop:1129 length:669 start_codon:yes stop_codon:yes gene_type:complete
MKFKVFYFSFITLLVALAVNPANANTRTYLSDKCKTHLIDFYQIRKPSFKDFKVLDEQEFWLHTILKRKGTNDVKVKAVVFQKKDSQRLYGLQTEWKDQVIINCWSFYHSALITLIEMYDHYDPFIKKQKDAIRVSTHYLVNCGVPCHHAEVTSTYMVDDGTKPYVRKEISTPTFEYPSIWFTDYLTLRELYQFMRTGDGWESFDWRGKRYNTAELGKKYGN